MKTSKKVCFWFGLAAYTVCYLYFLLVMTEMIARGLYYKSLLAPFSAYFYSDWMMAPVIGFGIGLLLSCGAVTHCTYGVFRRPVALLPCVGLLVFFLDYCVLLVSESADTKWLYICPLVLTYAFPIILWIFSVLDFRKL